MERVRLYKGLERTVAHSDDVEGILGDYAYQILVRARGNLSAHRKTGSHKVTQTKGRVDHYVNLEGPASMSLEEGHFVGGFYENTESIKYVDGLHVLRNAMRGL